MKQKQQTLSCSFPSKKHMLLWIPAALPQDQELTQFKSSFDDITEKWQN